jgi:hypothetical protein
MRRTPLILRQVSSHIISFAPYAIHTIKNCELTVPSAGGLPVQQPPSYPQAYPPVLRPPPPAFPIAFPGGSHAPMIQVTQQNISIPSAVTGQRVNGDPPPHHNLYPSPSIPQTLGNRACISSGEVFDVKTPNHRPAIGNGAHSRGHGNTERVSSEPDHLEDDEERFKGAPTAPKSGRPLPKSRSERFLSLRRLTTY